MKFKNKIIFIIVLTFSQSAYAFDMKNIAAYPVPFNPQKKSLTVGYLNNLPVTGHTMTVTIYDINGDLVIKKTRSGGNLIWNGRSASGRHVKPGLYILKVEIDDDTGDYGKKVIRILVDY